MKTITIFIALSFWMIISLILVCSLVGLLLFSPIDRFDDDNGRSTWCTIGLKLVNKLIE